MSSVFLDRRDSASARQPWILVVEDDSDNRLLMNYVLESLGFSFISASDGEEALQLAKRQLPRLILLDIVMPGMSGIEFIHHLQQDVTTSKIPVVAVTGLASVQNKEQLLLEGFTNYISKPYMIDELEAIIRSYCGYTPEPMPEVAAG